MSRNQTRRTFLHRSAVAMSGLALAKSSVIAVEEPDDRFQLSLHQYSLKQLFDADELDLLSYPSFVKKELGISNIEFGAEFCESLLDAPAKAKSVRDRSKPIGVRHRALLCADGNPLDAPTTAEREKSIAAHLQWAMVAEHLGCEFMRVRASGDGDRAQQLSHAAAGIGALCDKLKSSPVSVLVENIAGFSRDPEWLVELVNRVGSDRVGLIADFGNFEGDVYAGMKRLLPHARSICTKSWEFDKAGNETKIDFKRMMGLIKQSQFKGCIAIEYLGNEPVAGIKKTAELIVRYS